VISRGFAGAAAYDGVYTGWSVSGATTRYYNAGYRSLVRRIILSEM